MARAGQETRRSLADQVHDRLLDELMEGVRAANDTLNIPVLEAEFGMSQTPIREALARLEHTGLVRRQALRGYRVAPLFTNEELSMLMDVRQLIEPELAYMATVERTAPFLESLERTVGTLGDASTGTGAEAFRAYWKSDSEFHSRIAEQAGNVFLLSAYRALGPQIQRFRLIARRGANATAAASSAAAVEHRSILDAIASGDPMEAGARMSLHIARARSRALGEDDRAVVPPFLGRDRLGGAHPGTHR